jgi:alpha-L-fucosidase
LDDEARTGSGILFRNILGLAILAATGAAGLSQNTVDVKPSPQQTQWQDVILYFGTNTFLDREWGDGTADPKVFNPSQTSSFAIGHKKIDHFARVTAQRVRLNIVLSAGEARIRELQQFSQDEPAT